MTEKLYYYLDGERALGPNTLVELATAAGTGNISSGVSVAALGDSDWRPLSSLVACGDTSCGGVRSVDSQVNSDGNSPMRNDRGSIFSFIDSLTGLPRTKNLAWSAILSAIFRVHSDDDAAQAFSPQSDSIGTPWVFSRLLLGGLLAGALFYWALLQFNNTKLIVFGEKPKNLDKLKIEHSYIGQVNDDRALSLLYSSADVLLMPSKLEVFGQVGLEAQACGTPCVVFENTGLVDFVKHKQTGWVSKYLNINNYAEGINWILENEERYLSLVKKGVELVKENFDDNLIGKEFIKEYQKLIN